jgi:hypothetical protein
MKRKPFICKKHPELNGAKTGTSCKACVSERTKKWLSDPVVMEHRKVVAKLWREKNRERLRLKNIEYRKNNLEKLKLQDKENSRSYYLANREHVLEKNRKWRERNKDRLKELITNWSKNNRDITSSYWAKRKAVKMNATPKWANEFFIKEAYSLASLRSKMTGIKWSVDHIVPLQSKLVCGLHTESNLAVIPASLNSKKSNRVWPDMP